VSHQLRVEIVARYRPGGVDARRYRLNRSRRVEGDDAVSLRATLHCIRLRRERGLRPGDGDQGKCNDEAIPQRVFMFGILVGRLWG